MQQELSPREVFDNHINSLGQMLRTADVFTLLQIDHMRGTNDAIDIIKKVVEKKGFSTIIHSKHFFLSDLEQTQFENEKIVSGICQQIVQSSYAAIENYLINAFQSKLSERVQDQTVYNAILKNISFRSLDTIKKHYKSFLDIDLTVFSHRDISIYEEGWFHPRNEWHGLTILSKVRNEIAHDGYCKSYSIHHPVDANTVIQFIHRWVSIFDLNYIEERT